MHIIAFRDHGDQLITQDKSDNQACDWNDDRIRQISNHGEDTCIPVLRGLPDLRSNRAGSVIHIDEHGSQIARYKVGEKFPDPLLNTSE